MRVEIWLEGQIIVATETRHDLPRVGEMLRLYQMPHTRYRVEAIEHNWHHGVTLLYVKVSNPTRAERGLD